MPDPYVFIVKPRPDGGCELTGPSLPYPVQYRDEACAVDFAHHHARITGSIVLVLNRRGNVEFRERSRPIDHATATWCEARARDDDDNTTAT